MKVTEGTLVATPSIATREVFQQIWIDAGPTGVTSVTAINGSFIHINSGNGTSYLTFRDHSVKPMVISGIDEHEEFNFRVSLRRFSAR